MVDVFKMGWPAGLMFANEMICWALFMVYLVSHFGAEHATAGWIAHQYMSLSFMPAVGLSVAAAALVGKYQGMGRSDIATHRAWLAVKIALVYMGICAIIFLIFREQLIRAFVRDDTDPLQAERLVALGSKFLIATAAFQLFDAAAMTISGALRGAGDSGGEAQLGEHRRGEGVVLAGERGHDVIGRELGIAELTCLIDRGSHRLLGLDGPLLRVDRHGGSVTRRTKLATTRINFVSESP
jgi:hypothetical protein